MKKLIPSLLLGALCVLTLAMQAPHQVGLTPKQKAILNHFSIVDMPDGQGGTTPALRVTGNLQIVNGLGSSSTTNSLGNLIVGYHEETGTSVRTGSHNIINGQNHHYESHGGLIVGKAHTVTGPDNVIVGGKSSTSSFAFSAILGGHTNFASNHYATSIGGEFNRALGPFATSSGGMSNTANGFMSVTSGGDGNTADGFYSTVSGGALRTAPDYQDWVAGSLFEDN